MGRCRDRYYGFHVMIWVNGGMQRMFVGEQEMSN